MSCEVESSRRAESQFSIYHSRIQFGTQRRPEGPLANSHAREGVEQAIKLISRSEGPADD